MLPSEVALPADPRFLEIEHKFVMDDTFDVAELCERLHGLDPEVCTACTVRDVYYLLDGQADHIYRHRYDRELQHLTVKSFVGSAEARLEINLDLGHHRGDQQAVVEAFLDTLGVAWRGVVHKEIEVFEYPDCEVVIYDARGGGRRLRCVELEARGAGTVEEGLEVLGRWEERVGFAERAWTDEPLVTLLYPDVLAVDGS